MERLRIQTRTKIVSRSLPHWPAVGDWPRFGARPTGNLVGSDREVIYPERKRGKNCSAWYSGSNNCVVYLIAVYRAMTISDLERDRGEAGLRTRWLGARHSNR